MLMAEDEGQHQLPEDRVKGRGDMRYRRRLKWDKCHGFGPADPVSPALHCSA